MERGTNLTGTDFFLQKYTDKIVRYYWNGNHFSSYYIDDDEFLVLC